MKLKKIGPSLLVIGLLVFSGLAIMPATVVQAEQRQPDLVVRKIAWLFPVKEGEELPITVFIENVGESPVEDGFWMKVNYAELAGFWQKPEETLDIWVEPPIKAGEVKAVGFSTIALGMYQGNFDVTLDTTNNIVESNEYNNIGNDCIISVNVAPGTSTTGTVYLRNENSATSETFTIDVDGSTIPEGWEISGGIPPTQVTVSPGGNFALSETLIIPEDTILNKAIKLNATRQSDGASQSIFLLVQTTPEIGFSFNPYINDFSVWGVDSIDSDVSISSEIISQFGPISETRYTITNTQGQYISTIVKMISTRHLNMFEISNIDYNGVITINPDNNLFLTSFKTDHNNEIKHFYQKTHSSLIKVDAFYNTIYDQTKIRYQIDDERSTATYDGFEALGARVVNGEVFAIRLDTRDNAEPMCPNYPGCWPNNCYY